MLGEFDLEAAFHGVGVPGEDIKDEGAAVYDLHAEGFFQVALLGGSQLVVKKGERIGKVFVLFLYLF